MAGDESHARILAYDNPVLKPLKRRIPK